MPRLEEDLRNVALIAGSAVVAAGATVALFAAGGPSSSSEFRVHEIVEVRVERDRTRVVEAPTRVTNGAERLYGEVTTRSGATLEGFLRWDRNEGSWADLLDARKVDGQSTQTGVRFGQIERLTVIDSRTAELEMISGDVVELAGQSTDLGSQMRSLVVETLDGSAHDLDWSELAEVRFRSAPEGTETVEQRLHGRVTTNAGHEFVGFVTWDVDEIHGSDILDGEVRRQDVEIPFSAISRIERQGSRGAEVTLLDGETLDVRGTNDVDSGNRGISVSDPGLGQVLVEWSDVASVDFFPAETLPDRASFGHTGRVEGTVTGSSGDSWQGAVTWDLDESFGWEILNGHLDDAEFFVEFGQVQSIEKTDAGSRVTLRDGRSFELRGSQDVARGNRGIVIEGAEGEQRVRWSEFREFRVGG
ncbi:hypothetical protein [Gaopeijia maritima]|uniref:DUF5666 domain-containing protein n=1 Tax=Gaopeijia maritima TaxID=3119007 RepID=A0ABU9EC90_9BACT